MSVKRYKNKREKRHLRMRWKVKGIAERPRLSVFRSNRHIYAQLIDDERGRTLVSASDPEIAEGAEKSAEGAEETPIRRSQRTPLRSPRLQVAYEVGKLIAEKALEKGIKKVVFDRGGYKYHGRVKALAEGAREGGLEF